VRMYFGSWNEWSRDEAMPIETGLPFKAEMPMAMRSSMAY